MFCIVFPIAPIRNVFPQDGLWPGSEPNVNTLAAAQALNRTGMALGCAGWGGGDLRKGRWSGGGG